MPEKEIENVNIEELKENETVNSILSLLGELSEDEESGMEVFSALLEMPDEQFEVIAPVFLGEIEKAFNDTTTKISLVNAINVDGKKYEDLVLECNALFEEIDTSLSDDVLSPMKKDFFKNIISVIINTIGDSQMVPKRIVSIPVENSNEKLPAYAHITDAAMDIYAAEDYTLNPGDLVLVKTGLKVAIPKGYALLIQPRSGLSTKSKLRIPNTPGLIDSGYRGEICVPMENIEPNIIDFVLDEDGKATGILYGSSYTIEKGERIAQARLVEVPTISWNEVSNILDYESDRGEGGFGSTGTK